MQHASCASSARRSLMLVVFTVICGRRLPARRHRRRPGRLQRPGQRLADRARRRSSSASPLIGQSFTGARVLPPAPVGRRRRLRRRAPARGSNLGPTNPDLSPRSRSGSSPTARRTASPADAPVPVDAVTASGSGLDPHISVANARLQARGRRARGLDVDAVLDAGRRPHRRPRPRRARRAGGQRARAQPRPRRRSTLTAGVGGSTPMATRLAAHLPRRGARRRQDLRHAQRGPPPAPSAAPTSWSASSRPTAAASTAAQLGDLEVVPRRAVEYRGTMLEEMDVDAVLARRPDVALVDELAHTNAPGLAQREALAGRRGAARRGHRRDLDGQHPAPRIAQRRRRRDHRRRRSARRCPTRSCAAPTRSSSST